MIEEFRKYVEKFDFNDKNIKLKYYHSLRVKSLSKLIAKNLGCNAKQVKIAELVGLLHDYGRFKQWSKYHTFRDIDSIDHGDYGVEQLFNKSEISNFWLNKEDYNEIYCAIKYHNKRSILSNLTKQNYTMCKIIRDADKLDILYLYASNELTFLENGEISFKVKNKFEHGQLIDKNDQITEADDGLVNLAYIFDLNFDYSFKYLKQYKLVEQIYDNIKDKGKFRYYFDKISHYIDNRIKD